MRGFTFLEIIIFLSIAVFLMVIIAVSFSSFHNNQELNTIVQKTTILINLARSKTLSSEGFSQYGVHFETSRVVLFRGVIFEESNSDNSVTTMPPLIEISNINLNGGGNNLIFQKLTGKTENYGTITLRIKSDTSKTKIIDIKTTGIVNVL